MRDHVTINEAAIRLGCSFSTARRWITDGYRGVVLKTVKLRGRRFTTLAWIEEFDAETRQFGGSVEWAAEQSLKQLEELRHA